MKRVVAPSVLFVANLLAACAPASAASITSEVNADGALIISLAGRIERGDFENFASQLKLFASTKGRLSAASTKTSALRLNSPGGIIAEAIWMANALRNVDISTVVPNYAQCSSACFLIFAAGSKKVVGQGAWVGVHAASSEGVETAESHSTTVLMARAARDFGVPPDVIGRMVTTPPREMAWLTEAELHSMHVVTDNLPQAVPEAIREKPASTENEEDPADAQDRRYVGSVIWRTETASLGPGGFPELAVRADLEFPERQLTMTMSLRRNTDKALPASHTIEIRFNSPANFPFGGISNVPGILMKQAEQVRGAALAGLAVRVMSGFFLLSLSSADTHLQRNLQLLRNSSWFDIPIVYDNGKRAVLAFEKGTSGERAFDDAFAAWGNKAATPKVDLKIQPSETSPAMTRKPEQFRQGWNEYLDRIIVPPPKTKVIDLAGEWFA